MFYKINYSNYMIIQRFLEVPDQSGMTILSVTPENPLLWAFLMENFNLGFAKMSVSPENPLFPNPVLPKTSVIYCRISHHSLISPCDARRLGVTASTLGVFGRLLGAGDWLGRPVPSKGSCRAFSPSSPWFSFGSADFTCDWKQSKVAWSGERVIGKVARFFHTLNARLLKFGC